MRKKLTLMFVTLFAIAAFAATQVLNQATRRAAVSFDVPDGTELSAFIQSVIAENPAVEAYVFNLAANASYTLSAPIEVGKSISIIGNAANPATIDASAVTSTIVRMATPSFAANVNGFYEIDKLALENLVVKGVNYYIYDDNKNAYAFSNFIINNCLFELTNNKQDIDCPFRFQAGGPVKFSMTNSTMYQKGSFNYKYFVKIGSGNFPDKAFATFDGPYTWTIENNTFYKCLTDKMEFLNGGRVSNNYKKTALSLKNNIFVDCAKNNSFLKNLFGSKSSDKDLADFVSMETANNTYFANGVSVAAYADRYDKGLILPTDPGFADPENGDFTIGAGTAQAKEQTGDPRWLVEYDETKRPSKDVTVSPESGDINAAVTAELGEYFAGAKSLTVNLAAGAEYTVSAPLVANGNITVNGNGGTIDASALTDAFIKLSEKPIAAFLPKSDGSGDTDYYGIDNVLIDNVTVKGLKNSIFYDNNKKYCVVDFTINNSVLQLETEAVKNEALISFQAGGAKDFTIKNSTVYGNNAVAKYFIRYNNSARLDRYGFDKNTEFQTMTYQNNTFYGLLKSESDGQWGNYNGIAGQNYSKFVVEKNIWYNSSDEIIRRMAGGRFGSNAPQTFVKNTYFLNGADNSAKEAGYDKSGTALTTDPGFKDAANGDFTIGKRTHQNLYQTGDPRWLKDTEDYIAPQVGVSGTAAIDLTVPANLGKMDGTNGPTDLALFLDSYLQNSPNPAYIKLTLEPGAKYTISKPLTTMTAITIVGDESNPALIDASSLTGSFVEADELYAAGDPNANDFLTSIYNVEFKNFIVEKAQGSLFSSNGQKYDILYMTIDNVVYEANSYEPLISLLGGGIVENLTMTRSTAFTFGNLYDGTGSATLAEAGVNSQKFTFSYNTLVGTYGLVHADDSESAKRTITVDHNVILEQAANFVTGLNAGDANWIVQYNAFQKEVYTTNANGDYVFDDLSNTEDANGAAGSIKGNMVWVNTEKLIEDLGDWVINFPMGDCPQRDAKIGDPRWLSAKMRIKEADVDDDNDLAKVINEGVKKGYTEFELVQNQYGNLRYTVKQSIVTDKAISITGENVQIDVEHSDPFILLSKTPAVGFMPKASAAAPALNRAAVEYTDYYAIDALSLSGLKINGLKNSIIYDNNTKYCVVDLTIDDCVLGLETEAVKNEALISFQAGGVKDFTIKNSTVYGNNAVAKYFIRYNNSARLDRYGFDKNTEFQTMTYQNNTFYGLLMSDGQWGNYSGIAGQNYSKFVVEKNIWYNCGKDIIRRLSGGRFGGNAPRTFDKNTYFNEGADISDAEGSYDNSDTALTTDPGFKKPAEGDFTLSAYSAQLSEQTGDPRWFIEGGHYNPVTGIETVKTAEETSLENAVIYNLNGQRVEKAQKGINIVNGKKVIIK